MAIGHQSAAHANRARVSGGNDLRDSEFPYRVHPRRRTTAAPQAIDPRDEMWRTPRPGARGHTCNAGTGNDMPAPARGEGRRTRTFGRRIKNPLLYQLSYAPRVARYSIVW